VKKLFSILLLLPLLVRGDTVEQFWADRSALSNAVFSMSSPFTANAYFVDAASGSDTNSGKAFAPWATITRASSNASDTVTIYVLPGTYVGQITNGSWNLARGAKIQNVGYSLNVSAGGSAIITGSGDLVSTGGVCVYLLDDARVSIRARLIKGFTDAISLNSGGDKTFLRVINTQIEGTLFGETFGDEPETIFQGCTLIGSDAGMTTAYSVSGCTSTANGANAARVGSWVINTHLEALP